MTTWLEDARRRQATLALVREIRGLVAACLEHLTDDDAGRANCGRHDG